MKFYMFYDGYFLMFNVVLVIVFVIFGIYMVVGNILVFVVYILDLEKKLCWVFNLYFVINLVIVDILVGIMVEFINVVSYWIENWDVFFIYYIFVVLFCVCFIVNILVLMVDCFFVVLWLFKYCFLVLLICVCMVLLIIWLFFIYFFVLFFVGWWSVSF